MGGWEGLELHGGAQALELESVGKLYALFGALRHFLRGQAELGRGPWQVPLPTRHSDAERTWVGADFWCQENVTLEEINVVAALRRLMLQTVVALSCRPVAGL